MRCRPEWQRFQISPCSGCQSLASSGERISLVGALLREPSVCCSPAAGGLRNRGPHCSENGALLAGWVCEVEMPATVELLLQLHVFGFWGGFFFFSPFSVDFPVEKLWLWLPALIRFLKENKNPTNRSKKITSRKPHCLQF